MLSMLLDMEQMLGPGEGAACEAAMVDRFGHRAVAAALGAGLLKRGTPARRPRSEIPVPARLSLTERGRLFARHPGGRVVPIELAATPGDIGQALLVGARV